ncbi:hypothetical protein K1T71_012491 [Dendrolimus kikuchii]|uniref:Uncharacterized protein n=1 Tax=Dendrolimus kikuchii TaxID=765133 RepID=A0ACC1CJH3_9NEOP|nr:hypothetical protein K1T71_012491 [Dendrolimus kikuchii]
MVFYYISTYIHTYITSRQFPCGVGTNNRVPFRLILTHLTCLFDIHNSCHASSSVLKAPDITFLPIIPDWIHGESLALWTTHNAPLAVLLNKTVHQINVEDTAGVGGSQAIVGVVLGAKAAAQLITAPFAATAVCKYGPGRVLRHSTCLLTLAALVFTACSGQTGTAGAWCAGGGRALHGTAAALAGVSGLALCAAAVPREQRDRALGALLGAVALDTLLTSQVTEVAQSDACSSDASQASLAADSEANAPSVEGATPCSALRMARRGSVGACAGAVLFTTSVMAALEPCLPLWITRKFHPQRWQTGAVFIPDSAGYLMATSGLGGTARRLGAERVALAGQLAVGFAALAVPHASSVSSLALPHLVLGCGLGATDAALVPALVTRHPRHAPLLAALLQTASSGAYALGPIVGGILSWCVGFETAMRTLGVLNLLYAAYLYQALTLHPLSEQWGASTPDDDIDSEGLEGGELAPLKPQMYAPLH